MSVAGYILYRLASKPNCSEIGYWMGYWKCSRAARSLIRLISGSPCVHVGCWKCWLLRPHDWWRKEDVGKWTCVLGIASIGTFRMLRRCGLEEREVSCMCWV